MHWVAISTIAKKEARSHLQNLWLPIAALLFFFLSLGLARIGFSFMGSDGEIDTRATVLSLIHLQMYLVPLLAFILSYGGVLAERELGTFDLLLAYPLSYRDILLGKWLGYSGIFAVALLVGMGGASYSLHQVGISWLALGQLTALSLLLGIVCNSLGLLLSTLSRDRTTVIASCIVLWIAFVFLLDLGTIALLVLTEGDIPDAMIQSIMLVNPVGMFRIAAITTLLPGDAEQIFGLGKDLLSRNLSILSLVLWAAAPLSLSLIKPFHLRGHQS
jgi:Cu-processing system permease protein